MGDDSGWQLESERILLAIMQVKRASPESVIPMCYLKNRRKARTFSLLRRAETIRMEVERSSSLISNGVQIKRSTGVRVLEFRWTVGDEWPNLIVFVRWDARVEGRWSGDRSRPDFRCGLSSERCERDPVDFSKSTWNYRKSNQLEVREAFRNENRVFVYSALHAKF